VIGLETLNNLPVDEFTSVLGAIFEHSPWVPRRAAAARPFSSRLELLDAMRTAVQAAPVEEQLDLIRAHPQLGARGRKRMELTEASSREQRRAGLDACTDEEFAELMRLNVAYVQKFSFPFILAVRGHDPNSILAFMRSRLKNDLDSERHTALTQIGLIGGYRLADVVASPAGAEVRAMSERLTDGSPAALLREWMLAANMDVYAGADGSLAGAQQHNPSGECLLVGVYSDPTTGGLRRDGSLGSLLGIAVAQQIRQKALATRFNLCVLASPTQERRGSVLVDGSGVAGPVDMVVVAAASPAAAVRNPAAAPAPAAAPVPAEAASPAPAPAAAFTSAGTSTNQLARLRSAGITGPYMAFARRRTASDPTDQSDEPPDHPHTLERAVQTLETVLTQPRQIQ
jgi:OHCU decarboxylase